MNIYWAVEIIILINPARSAYSKCNSKRGQLMKKAWQEEGVLPDPWIPEATYALLLAVDTHLFSDLIHGPNSKTLDPIKEGE